jgi:hypothetical protein
LDFCKFNLTTGGWRDNIGAVSTRPEIKMQKKGNEFSKDREFGVILEGLRSDFRAFGDGLKFLDEKLAKLDNRADGIAANQARTLERVTTLEILARRIQTDVAEIKEAVKSHEKRLFQLEAVK